MKKNALLLSVGLFLGLAVGRILPHSPPTKWDLVERGMHYEEVYQKTGTPSSRLREAKGLDLWLSKSGYRYWSFTLYYDRNGKVIEIERDFRWH